MIGFGYLVPITVWLEMVSPPSRAGSNGLAIGIFAAGSGIFGPIAATMIERIGWRATFQIFAGIFFVFTMVGSYLLKDPPAGLRGAGQQVHRCGPRAHQSRRSHFAGDSGADLPGALGGVCARDDRGHHGDQPTGAFRAVGGYERQDRCIRHHNRRHRQRVGKIFLGLDVRSIYEAACVRLHEPSILTSMIVTPMLYAFREENTRVLCAVVFRLLLLWDSAVGLHLAGGRLLGNEVSGDQLWSTCCWHWGSAGVMGPVLGARVFVNYGNYRYAFLGAAGLACAALIILSLVRTPQPRLSSLSCTLEEGYMAPGGIANSPMLLDHFRATSWCDILPASSTHFCPEFNPPRRQLR